MPRHPTQFGTRIALRCERFTAEYDVTPQTVDEVWKAIELDYLFSNLTSREALALKMGVLNAMEQQRQRQSAPGNATRGRKTWASLSARLAVFVLHAARWFVGTVDEECCNGK